MATSPLKPASLDYLRSLPSADLKAFLRLLPKPKAADVINQLIQRAGEPAESAAAESDQYGDHRLSPSFFRDQVEINAGAGSVVRYGANMDDWQREDLDVLDEGWKSIVGLPHSQHCILRAYLERPKGHSKTTDIAVMAAWALFAAPHKVLGVVAAAAKDQAKLTREAIEDLVRCNPWMASFLDVQTDRVINQPTGSLLRILSSDAHTSHGPTPDFVIMDEVTHWTSKDLYDSLVAAMAKRPRCMVVIISNAGVGEGTSWQWQVRENARSSDDWYFHRLDGVLASWITQENLRIVRDAMTPAEYRRLYENQWSKGGLSGLNMADVQQCVVLTEPTLQPADGWNPVIAGLDLGIKHDHAAHYMLGIDVPQQRFRLMNGVSWRPEDYGGQIDLEDVEMAVLQAHKAYNLDVLFYDPYQAEYMAQRLGKYGIDCRPVEWTTHKKMSRMARRLVNAFRNQMIDLYDDEELLKDLARMSIEEKPQGMKLVAIRDEQGHCDRGFALAIALTAGMDWAVSLYEAMGSDYFD